MGAVEMHLYNILLYILYYIIYNLKEKPSGFSNGLEVNMRVSSVDSRDFALSSWKEGFDIA